MTRNINSKLFFLFFVLLISITVDAQVKLPGIFGDHMVLQRKMNVPVWGTAPANKKVTVQFAGQKKETTSDEDGKWKVTLSPLEASAKGNDLIVSDGLSAVTIKDVLVGEVWLCSGQSNMGVSLAEVDNSEAVIADADHPLIRMFKSPQTPALSPKNDVDAKWVAANPSVAKPFSAMGYFMAEQLQKELNVPVGMVVCCWGGSSVFAWMSEEALSEPFLHQHVAYDLIGYFENHRPKLLYNGMLHPLIPFAVKGVVWYQGETDAMDDRFNPYIYRYAFRAMINDWRKAWKREDMPFYFVQLPNLYGGKIWPVLRESQDIVYHSLKNTGMITTIDIGQSRKLHPTNKYQFAYRMADLLLAEQYGKARPSKFPSYKEMKADKDKITLTFNDAGGLKTNDGKEPLAFEIAGEDKVFKPAIAKIQGDAIVLTSKEVAKPMSVRYAFIPDPKVNVVNGDGLPLRPFRTDTWEVAGQERIAQKLPAKNKLETNFSSQDILDGRFKEWEWTEPKVTTAALIENKSLTKIGNRVRIQVISRRNADVKESNPPIVWKRTIATPTDGMTLEIDAQVLRANLPYEGFSLMAGIQDNDKLNLYRLDFSPLMIVAFKEEFIYILEHDIDNSDFHTYRLAIRKDGVCQVYYDKQLIGVIPPEVVEDKTIAAKGSFISFGKVRKEGDISANVTAVSYDGSGAYSPADKANP